MTTFSSVERDFHPLAPSSEFCSLRVVNNETERLFVQRNVVQPPKPGSECGAMITVFDGLIDLIGPRSAAEYQRACNGVDNDESPV